MKQAVKLIIPALLCLLLLAGGCTTYIAQTKEDCMSVRGIWADNLCMNQEQVDELCGEFLQQPPAETQGAEVESFVGRAKRAVKEWDDCIGLVPDKELNCMNDCMADCGLMDSQEKPCAQYEDLNAFCRREGFDYSGKYGRDWDTCFVVVDEEHGWENAQYIHDMKEQPKCLPTETQGADNGDYTGILNPEFDYEELYGVSGESTEGLDYCVEGEGGFIVCASKPIGSFVFNKKPCAQYEDLNAFCRREGYEYGIAPPETRPDEMCCSYSRASYSECRAYPNRQPKYLRWETEEMG